MKNQWKKGYSNEKSRECGGLQWKIKEHNENKSVVTELIRFKDFKIRCEKKFPNLMTLFVD